MLMVSIFVEFVKNTFCNLYMVGKIILAPIVALFTVLFFLFSVLEFAIVDIWVLVIALTSKRKSVMDCLSYFYG